MMKKFIKSLFKVKRMSKKEKERFIKTITLED